MATGASSPEDGMTSARLLLAEYSVPEQRYAIFGRMASGPATPRRPTLVLASRIPAPLPPSPPPQVWFYPKFHYVPNPDAINLNDFPNSYAFQAREPCESNGRVY